MDNRSPNKLRPKQLEFVRQYLVDLNATQAAVRAGYSKKTANQHGPRLLVNVGIQEAIQEYREELTQNGKIATPEEILEGYTRDIRFDPRKLFNENGRPKGIHELDDDTAQSLLGYRINESIIIKDNSGQKTIFRRTYEFKFPNKRCCRDSLAKHFGLIPRKH